MAQLLAEADLVAASLGDMIKPAANLMRGRPVAAVFEVCLRCNSACGYCDLPLNTGRYDYLDEMVPPRVLRLGVRFSFG